MSKPKKKVPPKIAELHLIRKLWAESRGGDEEAGERLLLLLGAFPTADLFAKRFLHMKELDKSIESQMAAERAAMKVSPWDRAIEKMGPGRAVAVGGGLPSLGKRAK